MSGPYEEDGRPSVAFFRVLQVLRGGMFGLQASRPVSRLQTLSRGSHLNSSSIAPPLNNGPSSSNTNKIAIELTVVSHVILGATCRLVEDTPANG